MQYAENIARLLQCKVNGNLFRYSRLSLSRLRLSQITAYLEEKIWSFFRHRFLTSGNKILWIRGEIAPIEEQFLQFSTIFSIYIFHSRSLITHSFVKFSCAICIFFNSENLIVRGSCQLRDNESRLYIIIKIDKMLEF